MKKVLVVEDNENNRYLISFILEKNGYTVLEATDGTSGIETAFQEKLDFILVDIQLPDMSGLEVAKRIRTSKIDSKIPIIAITSYAMVGDREKALAAGCTGYIEKPINPETIMDEIKRYL